MTIGIAVLAALLAAAVIVLRSGAPQLTEAPPRFTAPPPLAPKTSFVGVPFSIGLADLAARLEEEVPDTLLNINQNCRLARGRWGSISARCSGWLRRDGRIRVSGAQKTVSFKIPLKFRVTARSRGEIRVSETATGEFTVTANVRPELRDDWKLSFAMDTDFHWDRPAEIRVFGLRITVRGLVNDAIKKELGKLAAKLQKIVAEQLRLRERAAALWQGLGEPVELDAEHGIWAAAQPTAVFISPIEVRDGRIAATVGLEARVVVAIGTPIERADVGALPKPILGQPASRELLVEAPIVISHEAISDRLTALLNGRTFPIAWKKIQGELRVTRVSSYSTSPNGLALGFEVAASSSFLRTNGTVFLTGTPQIVERQIDGKQSVRFRLGELGFTPAIEGRLGKFGAWFLIDEVAAYLEQAQEETDMLDLSEEYETARAGVNALLNRKLSDGIVLRGEITDIKITEIRARADDVVAFARLTGHAEVLAE